MRTQCSSAEDSLQALRSELPGVTGLDVAKVRKEVSELETLHGEQSERLQRLVRSDPSTIAKLQEQLSEVKANANRWTDNIFILRQFICNKMNVAEESVNKTFGIPQDLDCIE